MSEVGMTMRDSWRIGREGKPGGSWRMGKAVGGHGEGLQWAAGRGRFRAMMVGISQAVPSDPASALLVVLNLVLIESVLSVDNAAVLAVMVMRLPDHQRGRALRIGLVFGYLFRGACLLLANRLMGIWWLGPLGGWYLLWLGVRHFLRREHVSLGDDGVAAADGGGPLFRRVLGWIGPFWATVLAVEAMDLAFSIDNVLAASAYTRNIWLVCGGVFLGILVMRFAAGGFVHLMRRYPYLETCAFVVILLLGVKLNVELIGVRWPESRWAELLDSQAFKLGWSALTLAVFAVPVAVHSVSKRGRRPTDAA